MPRPFIKPTVTEGPRTGGGTERTITHPAFATARVSRVSGKANLFDSNISHDGYIVMSFSEAKKHEDGYGERVHGELRTIFEVAMTENQFVACMTRMNIGSGVPVTVTRRQTGPLEDVPGIAEFENSEERLHRMADDITEVNVERIKRDAEALKAILECLPKKKQAEAASLLDYMTKTTLRNMEYGKTVMTEHAERLVREAKVEIDAHVTGLVTQLGVDSLHQLTQVAAAVHANTEKLIGKD